MVMQRRRRKALSDYSVQDGNGAIGGNKEYYTVPVVAPVEVDGAPPNSGRVEMEGSPGWR